MGQAELDLLESGLPFERITVGATTSAIAVGHVRAIEATAFRSDASTCPLLMAAAAAQAWIAAWVQLEMGTERTRCPFPTRSATTQGPSRC